MIQTNLPFTVGQNVEVRSFIGGYRGAWFRCKDGQNRQCAKLVKRKNEDICETGKEQTKRATQQQTERTAKHLKGDVGLRLNIMESDSIEAAVYDLEELIVRIDWLKDMLSPDVGEGSKSYWIYEDYIPSSKGM